MAGDFSSWDNEPPDESYTRMPEDVARIFMSQDRRRARWRRRRGQIITAALWIGVLVVGVWVILKR